MTDVCNPCRRPAVAALDAATNRFVQLMWTWTAWDGRPIETPDGERIYTPHKAVRRYADHLIDHLAQVEAVVSGGDPLLSRWQESSITTPADLAAFTDEDAREAKERIRRLTHVLVLRLTGLSDEQWRLRDGEWSVDDIVHHVADAWYAEQVGDLTAP